MAKPFAFAKRYSFIKKYQVEKFVQYRRGRIFDRCGHSLHAEKNRAISKLLRRKMMLMFLVRAEIKCKNEN